ncbi:MAG: hypothetical protein R2711_13490 [Acidimicrobiales bacterium]
MLDSIERTRQRPDAFRLLIAEHQDQVVALESLEERCASVLLRLSGREMPLEGAHRADRFARVSVDVENRRGDKVRVTLADTRPPVPPGDLLWQNTLLNDVGAAYDHSVGSALEAAAKLAHEAGVPLAQVLDAARSEVGAPVGPR